MATDHDFHKKILLIFGCVGTLINKIVWREDNVETPLHSQKITVWCALSAQGSIGPYLEAIEPRLMTFLRSLGRFSFYLKFSTFFKNKILKRIFSSLEILQRLQAFIYQPT